MGRLSDSFCCCVCKVYFFGLKRVGEEEPLVFVREVSAVVVVIVLFVRVSTISFDFIMMYVCWLLELN